MIFDLFLYSFVLMLIWACGWFVVSIIKKRNDIADIAWGLGYIFLYIFVLFYQTYSDRLLIMSVLVTLWGLRLAFHVFSRNRYKKEDFRYKQWRDEWGKWFYIRSFLQVYLLQGFIMLLIIFPVFIVGTNSQQDLNFLDLLGLGIWMIGFFFETVGDYQLGLFLRNRKKGEIMTKGLWKYSRHPNYFGEMTMWWGIFIISLSSSSGWLGIISPITITYLLVFVSGIPLLEKKYEGNKKFDEYKKKTSALIPWFPKK